MDPMKPIKDAAPEVKKIVRKVLQIESEVLYQDRPRILDDIVQAIKEAVK